ncbi:transglycosylase [Clostridium botulinum C str. Eklund]|nr:transglycosylase [Clostridium botulinum C str. Eklund]NEZ50249.1 transglycosylase [Clostridium botulinum]
MLVICDDGCKEEFELTDLKELNHDNDIVEVYFNCPNCGKKYICCYTDKSIRLKQKRLNKLWKKYRSSKRQGKVIGTLKMIEKLKVEIKNDMNNLKIKMLEKKNDNNRVSKLD